MPAIAKSSNISGFFSATDQMNALVYGNSDIEPPPTPEEEAMAQAAAQPAGYRPSDAYESQPAPAEAPPPQSGIGYTPEAAAPAPAPESGTDWAAQGGASGVQAASDAAPPPTMLRTAGSLGFTDVGTPALSPYSQPATSPYPTGSSGYSGTGVGVGPRNYNYAAAEPDLRDRTLQMRDTAPASGFDAFGRFDDASQAFFQTPGGQVVADAVMGLAGPGRLGRVGPAVRVPGRRTAPAETFFERPGTIPAAAPQRRSAARFEDTGPMAPRTVEQITMPKAPANEPMPDPPPGVKVPQVVNAAAPGNRTFPALAGKPGAESPGGGIWGPRGTVAYPRQSQIAAQEPIPMPETTQPAPGVFPKASPGAASFANAAKANPLTPGQQTRINAAVQNAHRPSRPGVSVRRGAGVLGALGLGLGALGEALTPDDEAFAPQYGPGSNRPGDVDWAAPTPGTEWASPLASSTGTARQSDERIGRGPAPMLRPDGTLGEWQQEDTALGAGPAVHPDYPRLGVLHVDEAGNVRLTDADVLDASYTAAAERGEAAAALDEAEFDALMAAGLITDAEGNPIPAEDVADWKAAIVGRAILAPAAWAPYIKGTTGSEEAVTFTPVEEAATVPAAGAGGGSSDYVDYDDWSGGGSGYTRRSYGGGGGGGYSRSYGGGGGSYGGGGGGGGFPGTFPQSARGVLGDDFMAGFMDDFAFGDMGGGGGGASGMRSSSKRGRRRGRTRRGMRGTPSRTPMQGGFDAINARIPGGLNENAAEALMAALALRDR